MTLDEAIKHAEGVAERLENSHKRDWMGEDDERCAKEHRQLAEWLKELKAYREREPSYEAGYNDAKREIALSSEYKRCYNRGWHDALSKALNEAYSIHCEEGNFKVVQSETLIGLGMSRESEE